MAVEEKLRFSGDCGYSDFSAWRGDVGKRHGPFIGGAKVVCHRREDKLMV
jgi:hypothetical protein